MTDNESIKSNLMVAMQCIENIWAILERNSAATCEHPQDKRDYSASTMGNIQWTCEVCGHKEKEEGGES
jgi:hypothetical protein